MPKNKKIKVGFIWVDNMVRSCMLMILMAKPKQFTSVSPVPFSSGGTALATKLENWGESAVTAMPQRLHPIRNNTGGNLKSKGERIQNSAEPNRA